MTDITGNTAVERQYATPRNLTLRASLHEKYSVNRQGLGPWILSHYAFRPGDRILELGCGTGSIWMGQLDALPEGCALLLTDLSPGMLDTARTALGERPNLEYEVADIQSIPCPDRSFDAVIANMMLYHVPDLSSGLAQVRRVLRHGGTFYCATYGEHGIIEYLSGLLGDFGVRDAMNRRFTRQNGSAILSRYFSAVRWEEYPDALEVTRVEDVADYLYSLTGMAGLDPALRPAIVERLRGAMRNGALHIPKEYGMFICT